MQSSHSQGVNPILALVSQADTLANAFTQTHAQSIPLVSSLLSPQVGGSEEAQEHVLSSLRAVLQQLEAVVGEMMSMLYRVDLFLSEPTRQGVSGYDPKEACRHVSELFHMYQSELLSKRELLADYTCEDVDVNEFVQRWQRLDEVQQGKKQEVDDLADLLSRFG